MIPVILAFDFSHLAKKRKEKQQHSGNKFGFNFSKGSCENEFGSKVFFDMSQETLRHGIKAGNFIKKLTRIFF